MARDHTLDAAKKFRLESSLVKTLVNRLGLTADCEDPNNAEGETGADVIALIGNRRIGVQVTRLDTGDKPGKSRAKELKAQKEAEARCSGIYGVFAQNDVGKFLQAIVRAVQGKVQQIGGCCEAWLLVSANVPELGAFVSTFVAPAWPDIAALNAATCHHLVRAKYDRAFLHAIVASRSELFCWTKDGGWTKSVLEPARDNGSPVWDLADKTRSGEDPREWLTDRKLDEEIDRALRDVRSERPSKDDGS